MLKKERLKKHFNKEWESMLSHIQAFYDSKDPEEAHQVRLQIKKINALLFFLKGYSNGKKISKHFHPIKLIFKHFGDIRSAHINLSFIKKYQMTNVVFKNEQDKIVTNKTIQLYSKQKTIIKAFKRSNKVFLRNFHSVENNFILNRYEKQLKKLLKFFDDPSINDDKLHDNRKKLKVLLYFYKVLHKTLVNKLKLNIPYLNKLQDLIGKWHDLISMIELFKIKGPADKQIIDKLNKQSKKIHYEIKSLSNNFGNKVILRS